MVALAGDQLDPDLVGIDGSLGQRMAQGKGAHHNLEQVFLPRQQRRNLGPQGTHELPFDPAALTQREDIDTDLLFLEELGMSLGGCVVSLERWQSRIGSGKEVVVNLPHALAVEVPGPEVVRGQQVHVALVAV